jgi:hypothetical protein
MERIVIEVPANVAKAWRKASDKKRVTLENEVSARIGKELLKDSKEEYLQYINNLQKTMKERGLTQEVLDDILRDED